MLKIKNSMDDKIPIEDDTPTIINSAKLLVRVTGTGASLGTLPSIGNTSTAIYILANI